MLQGSVIKEWNVNENKTHILLKNIKRLNKSSSFFVVASLKSFVKQIIESKMKLSIHDFKIHIKCTGQYVILCC